MARSAAYKEIPANGALISLPDGYNTSNAKVVDEQIQRAGVRLATVLNDAFG